MSYFDKSKALCQNNTIEPDNSMSYNNLYIDKGGLGKWMR